MSWFSKAIGTIGKIGGIASKFANSGGIIGKIAGGVSKAAGLISTLAPKAAPWIAGATIIGKALYNTGIADKITGGLASRVVKGITNIVSPFKGNTVSNAGGVHQAASTTNTGGFSFKGGG